MKFALVLAVVSAAEKQVCSSDGLTAVADYTAPTTLDNAAACGTSCTEAVAAITDATANDYCCQYKLGTEDGATATCELSSRTAAGDSWATTMVAETADSGTNQAWEWKAGVLVEEKAKDAEKTDDTKTDDADADSAKALAASLVATAALAMAY